MGVRLNPTFRQSEIGEKREGEGVAHWVDKDVGNELSQRFPTEINGTQTLTEQGEGGKSGRFHPNALT